MTLATNDVGDDEKHLLKPKIDTLRNKAVIQNKQHFVHENSKFKGINLTILVLDVNNLHSVIYPYFKFHKHMFIAF
jgi:hypothetical protein